MICELGPCANLISPRAKSNQRFCSHSHTVKGRRERLHGSIPMSVSRPCTFPDCGSLIPATAIARQKYCSAQCRNSDWARVLREVRAEVAAEKAEEESRRDAGLLPAHIRDLEGLERQLAMRAYLKTHWVAGPSGVLRTRDLGGYALEVWRQLDRIDEADEFRGIGGAYYSPDVSDYQGPPSEPTRQRTESKQRRKRLTV